MLRLCTAATAALVIGTASAGAQQLDPPGEPTPAQIAHAAATCTADGALGFRFGESYEGYWAETKTDPEHTPFLDATINTFGPAHRIYEIQGFVDFQGGRPAAARDKDEYWNRGSRFFHSVDEEIRANRHFAVRKQTQWSVLYRSSADHAKGYTLRLIGDGPMVELYCTDKALERKAWNGKPRPGSDD